MSGALIHSCPPFRFFGVYHGHEFSFTDSDCTSFVLMMERKLKEALATVERFLPTGFVPVLRAD